MGKRCCLDRLAAVGAELRRVLEPLQVEPALGAELDLHDRRAFLVPLFRRRSGRSGLGSARSRSRLADAELAALGRALGPLPALALLRGLCALVGANGHVDQLVRRVVPEPRDDLLFPGLLALLGLLDGDRVGQAAREDRQVVAGPGFAVDREASQGTAVLGRFDEDADEVLAASHAAHVLQDEAGRSAVLAGRFLDRPGEVPGPDDLGRLSLRLLVEALLEHLHRLAVRLGEAELEPGVVVGLDDREIREFAGLAKLGQVAVAQSFGVHEGLRFEADVVLREAALVQNVHSFHTLLLPIRIAVSADRE